MLLIACPQRRLLHILGTKRDGCTGAELAEAGDVPQRSLRLVLNGRRRVLEYQRQGAWWPGLPALGEASLAQTTLRLRGTPAPAGDELTARAIGAMAGLVQA